jgi:hypothetical protein
LKEIDSKIVEINRNATRILQQSRRWDDRVLPYLIMNHTITIP